MKVLAWIWSVLCGLVAIGDFANGSVIGGIAFAIMSFLALPLDDVRAFREGKGITRKKAIWISVGLFIVAAITTKPPAGSATKVVDAAPIAKATDATPAATPTAEVPNYIEVSATTLFQAYAANEAKAQMTYGDHQLKVSGVLDSVDLDFGDDPVLQLRTGDMFQHVAASGIPNEAAATLTKGHKVTVICEKVSEVIGSPQLSGCQLAE